MTAVKAAENLRPAKHNLRTNHLEFGKGHGYGMNAKRRHLFAAAGASVLVATPAVHAQTSPAIRWRMATSFPKTLDVLHGAAERMTRRIGELTQGQFNITVHAAGELMPAFSVFDGVSNNTVQCGYTVGNYSIGRNSALAFDKVLPFGLNARHHLAWMRYAGGLALLRDLYKTYNIVNHPAGNTGSQMGGWFRKPVKSLADLKGLRMRIPGWGGRIMAEMGVIPQSIPGGDVYVALEKGVLDASEFVGPADDEKLGFIKVAPYYHFPGWWEPCAQLSLFTNAGEFEKLPRHYQSAVEVAAAEAYGDMLAHYDVQNPLALRRLVSAGAQLVRFPDAVLDAARQHNEALLNAEAESSPVFAALLKSYREFRDLQAPWYEISEYAMEAATRRRRT
jgi:TRAP-type mannitol/chloroaromatic compound transport system substrate-binding protein